MLGKMLFTMYLAHNGSFTQQCLRAIQKYPYFLEGELIFYRGRKRDVPLI